MSIAHVFMIVFISNYKYFVEFSASLLNISKKKLNFNKHFINTSVPAKVMRSPNISRRYVWTDVQPGQTYLGETFGLMYKSAKCKFCNLKNRHNTKK